MTSRRPFVSRRLIVTACASLLATVGTACERSAVLRAPSIGAIAPEFTAMDLEGAPVTLASLKGRVVVLNVWATWCRPCLEEIPQLEAFHEQLRDESFTLVGVSIDAAGMGADVKDFMVEHNMQYTVWLDPDHNFSLKFLTMGVPETFVIDRAGVIRARQIGAVRPGDSTLVTAVRAALADPTP
jgi:cytochrome c biogenesis protein CcmG, thiol:disulfide interchange protein DsbE